MKRKQLWAGLATVVTLASVALPLTSVYAQDLDGTTMSGDVPFSMTVADETGTTDPEEPIDPDTGGTTEPTTDPEEPIDPDTGGTTDPDTGGTTEPTTDPEEPTDPDTGGTTEPTTDPEEPVASDYMITIPSGLSARSKRQETVKPKDLVDFAVTAKNVKLADKQAVQVTVQAREDYQVNGENVLIGEDGTTLGYSFEREADVNYGLESDFDAGDERGIWTIAQFRDDTDALHTEAVPISIVTDDALVEPGVYSSILKFTVSVVDTQATVIE